MKDILVDLYKIKDPYSGLGQFSLNFSRELIQHIPESFDLTFLVSKNNALPESGKYRQNQATFYTRFFSSLQKPISIWHSLHQFPAHLPGKNPIWILTIHDLNFLVEKNGFRKRKYLDRLRRYVDRADYITTISDFTQSMLRENLNVKGKDIRTIYNGIPDLSTATASKPRFMEGEKYFFSLGIFSEKKNFHSLIPMMSRFNDTKLVLAGNCDTPYGSKLRRLTEESGLGDKVIFPGKVSEGEKVWLYANCEAVLFPSQAEGFGMPVVEAMYFGKPVFLSRYASLPEIGGDAAYYFENFDPDEMSRLVKEKLSIFNSDRMNRSNLIRNHARTFSWERSIGEYLNLYQEIFSKQSDKR